MAKILVADDESRIRHLVCDYLKKNGYDSVQAEDGEQAYNFFENDKDLSLIILDVMMPEMNGWEVCKKIRETSNIPIIMLTAREQEFDELMGFESGADDYITKPFSPSVLVKRIDAILRRSNVKPIFNDDTIGDEHLRINENAHEVILDGENIDLTLKEYSILVKLFKNLGRVYTREQLLDDIWGFDYVGDERTVDSHVARLRTKLGVWGNNNLKTVYGMGYKIEVGK